MLSLDDLEPFVVRDMPVDITVWRIRELPGKPPSTETDDWTEKLRRNIP